MGLVGRRWGRVGWWQGGGERGGDRLAGWAEEGMKVLFIFIFIFLYF